MANNCCCCFFIELMKNAWIKFQLKIFRIFFMELTNSMLAKLQITFVHFMCPEWPSIGSFSISFVFLNDATSNTKQFTECSIVSAKWHTLVNRTESGDCRCRRCRRFVFFFDHVACTQKHIWFNAKTYVQLSLLCSNV